MMETIELTVGDRVRLLNFGQTDLSYRLRLLSMGINVGAEVTVMGFAPLGCPMLIKVQNTLLSLRKEEAALLQWELT